MSCRDAYAYGCGFVTVTLPMRYCDAIQMGDFQVATAGGVWVAAGASAITSPPTIPRAPQASSKSCAFNASESRPTRPATIYDQNSGMTSAPAPTATT